MTGDTPADNSTADADDCERAQTASDDTSRGSDTIRPPIPDRHSRRVRDDHAPVQSLHDALHAAITGDDPDGITDTSVNMVASHAPGEKSHDPTYEVTVTTRNAGMGHPILHPVVRRLVKRGKVKITDVPDVSDDHLRVSIRPIETVVEPIEFDERWLPDKYIDEADTDDGDDGDDGEHPPDIVDAVWYGYPTVGVGHLRRRFRPPTEPIREWVEDNEHRFVVPPDDDETSVDDVVDAIADAIEQYNLYGTTADFLRGDSNV